MKKDNTNKYKSHGKKRINKLLRTIDDLNDFAENEGVFICSIGKEINKYRNRIRRLKEKYGI